MREGGKEGAEKKGTNQSYLVSRPVTLLVHWLGGCGCGYGVQGGRVGLE